MMRHFGFGEWAKEENFALYKKAMAKLKEIIFDKMGHEKIRAYIHNRKRMQYKPMFVSYIWKFICGEFRQGDIKDVQNRKAIESIRENKEKESKEDEEMKRFVISSGS